MKHSKSLTNETSFRMTWGFLINEITSNTPVALPAPYAPPPSIPSGLPQRKYWDFVGFRFFVDYFVEFFFLIPV